MNRNVFPGSASRLKRAFAAAPCRRYVSAMLWCALLLLPFAGRAQAPSAPMHVLIVGGGPDMENNQVAIESNVRYLGKLLPADTVRTTLFADGDANHATVLYDEDFRSLSAGEQLLRLLLKGRDAEEDNPSHYRKPNLGGKLDGASKTPDVNRAFTQLSRAVDGLTPPPSVLLYFTGHGSSNRGNLENNVYDLWGKEGNLSVQQLAGQIARLPENVPVTVVMVQCFSGAFGNLIFEGGDPQGRVVSRDLAGFFATVKERVAAGCTSAVNEAEYHDFTSYFFAALTGRDRVGRAVTGADYNGDGRVGMDEAFDYTLANDKSIDVPVCTSDVFLRRFVPMADIAVFRTPYRTIRDWASPGQRAALEALSAKVSLTTGDDRLMTAYRKLFGNGGEIGSQGGRETQLGRRFEQLRQEGRQTLFRRWPELRLSDTQANRAVREEAVRTLTQQANDGQWNDLMEAARTLSKAEMDSETEDIKESYLLRFVRLGKSIVLAHHLRETGDAATKARFERLLEAEGRTLLPPADSLKDTAFAQP